VADQLEPSREILREIHANRFPISGGTGKRPRYEMRKTSLYFKLGLALIDLSRNHDELAAESILEHAIIKLQSEFNDSENVFRWSVRFVRSFEDEAYFEEVSRICHYSFGQLREAIDVLDKRNSLQISDEDKKDFISKMSGPVTYEDVRKLCMNLKSKYLGTIPDLDTASLSDLFDTVEHRVTGLIESDEITRRSWGEDTGVDSIIALRHVLMLLSREMTYLDVQKKKPSILRSLKSRITTPNADIELLYRGLHQFLQSGPRAREEIRRLITTARLGYLQTTLKALVSEKDYRSYVATKDLMNTINI